MFRVRNLSDALFYLFFLQITVADIMVFSADDSMQSFLSVNVLEGFPKLTVLKQKVGDEPKIAAWLAKRPQTAM